MAPKNLYEILGVPAHASRAEIAVRYGELLREARASIRLGKPLPIASIDDWREAYHTLHNPATRAQYDAALPRAGILGALARKTRNAAKATFSAAAARRLVNAVRGPARLGGSGARKLRWALPGVLALAGGGAATAWYLSATLFDAQHPPRAAAARIGAETTPYTAPLLTAAATGDAAQVRHLLDRGADINVREHNADALHLAVLNGHADVAQLLLARGAEVNVPRPLTGSRNLHVLGRIKQATPGHARVLELLLAHGADADAQDAYGHTPLIAFATDPARALAYVKALHAHRGAQRWRGVSQAPRLATAQARAAITFLLEQGYDVNARDDQGAGLLHYAALADDAGLTQWLLSKGANATARSEKARTPLHYARSATQVRTLLAAGADVDARDAQGRTPLHNIGLLHLDAAALLLAARAKVNAADNSGATPLHEAARRGGALKIRLLIEAGANAKLADHRGVTPEQLARARNYAPVAQAIAQPR